jgi:hypothetical protein
MRSNMSKCSTTSNDYIDFLTNNYLSYDDMYRDMVKANTERNQEEILEESESEEAVEDIFDDMVEDDTNEYVDQVADSRDRDSSDATSDDDLDFESLIRDYRNGSYDPYRMPIGIDMPNYSRYQDDMPSYLRPDHRNMEEDTLDNDIEFIKDMYPRAARVVLQSIEDECDKLEYADSCMFDEYPDRTNISRILIRIYENVKNMDFVENDNKVSEVEITECCRNRYCSYNRSIDCCEDGSPNWLCQMIQIMFYQELINRRRRYRYRRWR